MTPDERTLARAEFYLCLARAFAVPSAPGALAALRDGLAADLTELADRCGYPLGPAAAELRAAATEIGSDARLLVVYSRLFLVPGDAHPSLNAGAYLDGAIGGGSAAALAGLYRACGLEPDSGFRDLPDQVTMQLECLAWLLAGEAQGSADRPPAPGRARLLRDFIARWVGPLRRDIEAAGRRFGLSANPYLALASALEAAISVEFGELPAPPPRPEADPTTDPEIARRRSQCAGRELSADDLRIIRARLAADGLPSDHVAIPVAARDRAMGLGTMTPPVAPSHRHRPAT